MVCFYHNKTIDIIFHRCYYSYMPKLKYNNFETRTLSFHEPVKSGYGCCMPLGRESLVFFI